MRDGQIVDEEGGEEDGEGGATMDRVLSQVTALCEAQQNDALVTHARIAALETALIRSTGVGATRDPSMMMRRPAVQQALRRCAVLATAISRWSKRSLALRTKREVIVRMAQRRLFHGWNSWLEYSVRRMHSEQLRAASRSFSPARAMTTWRAATIAALDEPRAGPSADDEPEAGGPPRAIVPARDLRIVIESP